jgi:hypothetical protein
MIDGINDADAHPPCGTGNDAFCHALLLRNIATENQVSILTINQE